MASDTGRIPIRNIYNMLAYVWDTHWKTNSMVGLDSMGDLDDLLTRLLLNGISNLRKRGFNKDYSLIKEPIPSIKGHIDVVQTMKPSNRLKMKAACEYDEYNIDNDMNRIILKTIRFMSQHCSNESDHRKLVEYSNYFKGVKELSSVKEVFKRLVYQRNNRHYHLLMDICEMYWSDKFADEIGDNHQFTKYEDLRLCSIFERFLLKFYQKHFPSLDISSKKLDWVLDEGCQRSELLQHLQTDIFMVNKRTKKVLIMDAKFYRKMLCTNRFDVQVLRNEHLCQVYAYIGNATDYQDYDMSGMLVYPKVDASVNEEYPIKNAHIWINTIDLSEEWIQIEKNLISFIQLLF